MLKRHFWSKSLLILVAGSVLIPAVNADSLAVDFSTLGSYFTIDAPISVGWQFQVLHPITVTSLGDLWLDTFTENHDVGIFSSTGTLLASTTVTSADPQTSFFRLATITPITLQPGTYRIAETTVFDPWTFIPVGKVINSAIDFQNGYFTYGSSLQYPASTEPPYDAYFGPTFLIANAPVSTPEASTWVLMVGGLALLLGGSTCRLRRAAK